MIGNQQWTNSVYTISSHTQLKRLLFRKPEINIYQFFFFCREYNETLRGGRERETKSKLKVFNRHTLVWKFFFISLYPRWIYWITNQLDEGPALAHPIDEKFAVLLNFLTISFFIINWWLNDKFKSHQHRCSLHKWNYNFPLCSGKHSLPKAIFEL